MFENLLHQNAAALLREDFFSGTMPPSVLFSGPLYSGKLTAALELARVFSCEAETAKWQCSCSACLRHKSLVHPDLMLLGPKDCALEISAAARTFMTVRSVATRYLFVRAVRKLLMRFNPVLWTDDEAKLAKAVPLIASLNELTEEIDSGCPVEQYDDPAVFDKIIADISAIVTNSGKLESGFLPDSIPVSQVRNISYWAHMTPSGNKKVVIIENAEKMADASRNAFLKILEEPPATVQFILTTSQRGAVLPTILSRVRTYAFVDRSPEQQRNVLDRVFHSDPVPENQENVLKSFFYQFLPVSAETIIGYAAFFLRAVIQHNPSVCPAFSQTVAAFCKMLPDSLPEDTGLNLSVSREIVSGMNGFEPRILFTIFLNKVLFIIRSSLNSPSLTPAGIKICSKWGRIIREVAGYVSLYNQSPAAALDLLVEKMRAVM